MNKENRDKPIHPSEKDHFLRPVLEVLQGKDPDAVCLSYGISREELNGRMEAYQASRRQVALAEHLQMKKVKRNDPCPCGSGKKFKKCCLSAYEEARKNLPPSQLQASEERMRAQERLEEDIRKGFDQLFVQDFAKAEKLASRLLKTYPEDDRLHDILITSQLATGQYDEAFLASRRRWQIAIEERDFYRENGYHKRQGADRSQSVHFYSPSTWLEKFWIAQRARTYREQFPKIAGSPLQALAEQLKVANDSRKFPDRQEEGYEKRKAALSPILARLEAAGEESIPYLLPLTFYFSWASLFVPDLLMAYGTDVSLKLLGELSMFRFPFFAQKCLANLETFGERAAVVIEELLSENPAFDELKGGMIKVLGGIRAERSKEIFKKLVDHENIYVIKWVAEGLDRYGDPELEPYLARARERLEAADKASGLLRGVDMMKG